MPSTSKVITSIRVGLDLTVLVRQYYSYGTKPGARFLEVLSTKEKHGTKTSSRVFINRPNFEKLHERINMLKEMLYSGVSILCSMSHLI